MVYSKYQKNNKLISKAVDGNKLIKVETEVNEIKTKRQQVESNEGLVLRKC